jgi:hypothetical protein
MKSSVICMKIYDEFKKAQKISPKPEITPPGSAIGQGRSLLLKCRAAGRPPTGANPPFYFDWQVERLKLGPFTGRARAAALALLPAASCLRQGNDAPRGA